MLVTHNLRSFKCISNFFYNLSIFKEKERQLIYKLVLWYCNEEIFATANIICNRWIAGPKKYYSNSEKKHHRNTRNPMNNLL